MQDSLAVKSYVDDLFRYLQSYESDSQSFETEAFLQTYNGIKAVFHALREQRDKAVEVDRYFLDMIRQSPLTSSDLRQLTVQVLVTFFEAEADIDGRSNKAFSYIRGLRAVKQDVPYFENHLVPLLFVEGALNNNFRLNEFFMNEVGRYLNTFGRPLNTGASPEQFSALAEPAKFLELVRRRLQLGENLITDRTSLEFHLQRVGTFNKVGQGSSLAHRYLKHFGYLQEASFWSKVGKFFGELGGKIKGAFSSSRYTRLVLSQRNPAYLFYGLIIVIFLFLAIWVPMKWSDYGHERLDQMQERAHELQSSR
ncbi:MAG TPA: hypothetical protein PLF13_09490 [candidate division Zixibacteria bacterium]|nr:hypothetical protein [candidate division Zixibacteria bacterium]